MVEKSAVMSGIAMPPDGLWLGLETSQRVASVALGRRVRLGTRVEVLGESRLDPAAGSALERELLTSIEALLTVAETTLERVAGVVVATGPGGFTGTRIGVATAQGMAEAIGVPIAGVPSAIGAALGLGQTLRRAAQGAPVLVALAAKGDACWLTEIELSTLAVREAREVAESDATLVRSLSTASALVGDEHTPAWLRGAAAERGIPIESPIHSAASVLCAANWGGASHEWWTTDPARVVPLYARAAAVTVRSGG